MRSITLALLTFLTCFAVSSSGQSLIVPNELRLNIDSTTKTELIASLNGFLDQKDKPNKDNAFVSKDDLLEMSALLDEFKGVDKNPQLKDDHFYKPYLTNVVTVGDNTFLVQLAYAGIIENKSILRANFTLYAKKRGDLFYFYCPLNQNTASWKTKKMDYITFHFKDTLNTAEAKAYLAFLNLCDKKLNVMPEPLAFYDCDNFPEACQILGVGYKLNYAGVRYNDFTSHENGATLEINGGYTENQRFDRHDTWHDRLHMVLSTTIINRPVDEGCAYLFGGSWGTPWGDILAMFKQYGVQHPDADWMKLYVNSDKLRDDDKPIYFAYVINALFVQKIDKEKGFTPVMQLLSSGPREKGDENYFKALEKVSGISKADFNQQVWDLVKQ